MIAIRGEIDRVAAGEWTPETLAAARCAAHLGGADRRVGPRLLPRARGVPDRLDPTSTGRRSPGSTRPTATATWSAPARRPEAFAVARRRMSAPIAGLTARRLDVLLATSRSTAGCPRSSAAWPGTGAGVDGSGVRAGRGDARAGRAVPDRLDHQDPDRGAGPAAARRGRARPRRPARRAPARIGVRRPHRCATCWRTPPACRPSRRRRGGSAPRAAVRRAGRRARRLGAAFEAGATYHYSNVGYALLGEVVARLPGQSWWDVSGRGSSSPRV